MKSCPTCNRTYPDDTLAFCLMDGAVLSAPYDHSSEPRRVSPSPTEVVPRAVVSEDPVIPATIQSPPISTMQASPPSVPSVNLPDETESKVTAEDLDRLVRVWEDKVGARRSAGNTARLVLLRLLAFGLAVVSAFFALRALMVFFQEGYWQFGLVQAAFALLVGWAAQRSWRLSTNS
jgi:hypothetical protein